MTNSVTNRTRGPRPGSEGFKLLEVLVSMAILMIASVAIVRLHGTIIRGIASSEDASMALDIATQRLDDLSIIGATSLPVFTVGVNGAGCQVGIGSDQYSAELAADPGGYPCTRRVDSAQVIMANGNEVPDGTRFRVDTAVEAHPDIGQFPEGRIVTVSVCWEDIAADIRQVQVRRYVVPEV